MRRLLSIAHSYVVAANRRLAGEMARAGRAQWEVVAAAPALYAGDFGDIALESIPGEGCEVVAIPMRRAPMPHLARYGTALRGLLHQQWDVVHCWEEPYVAAAAQVARWTPGKAKFFFATFQNIRKRYPPPLSLFERSVLRRADGWIAFGRTVHETHARRRRYAALPSRVIPPGVDTALFRPDAARRQRVRERIRWNDADPVVGYVGRFVPHKGVETILDALTGVAAPWRALFVGGGPGQRSLESFAAAHVGRVHVVTGVRHDEVAEWLNAIDVLCVPSRTGKRWREQFGRVLIEAMASGVPVLASDSGEIPYVVGGAGQLLPERDVAAWASAIQRACTDAGWRREVAARGLARARAQFDWSVVAARHLRFFDEVLAKR